ncbi:RsmE family RNA methyltransferase [Treponema sp.]|uniref:RsmE family RNA methyltransferase n=1 Tax=Treponema sp. TaxID=166 RepID=UPI003F05C035
MRQLIVDSPLGADGCICIEGKKYHYLNSVLRVKCGDMVYARLSGGQVQPMTVARIDSSGKKIILQAAEVRAFQDSQTKAAPVLEKPETELWLFQFEAKPPKMDLIVRQAAECGVFGIVPVEGEFCQRGNIDSARKKSDGADGRWERIITEARQQSGSPVETRIFPSVSVQEACSFWSSLSAENKAAVVLYERSIGTQPLYSALKNADIIGKKKASIAVAVGAEGGISPDEINAMKEGGFVPVHFDTNILRCETASLYGIAALQTVLNLGE